jgi:MFS transporter, SHS family, sialic acid transporter
MVEHQIMDSTGRLTPPRSPIRSPQFLTLLAALLGWSFDGIEMGVFPLIARPALREFLGNEVDEETIRRWNGILAAAFLFGAAIGGVIFGRLGDRVGRVKALSLSVLVYALLTGASAFAQTPIQLALLRFLAAIGMGGEWALGVALVVETWPSSARPWLAGCIGAAVNVGYVAVAALAWWIEPTSHWRMLLGICVLPALLAFVVRAFVPESAQWAESRNSTSKSRWSDLVSLQRRRQLITGAAAGAVLMLAVWGGVQTTQLWAAQLGGADAATKVQLISAGSAAVGAFLGPLLLINLSRRMGWAMLCAIALATSEAFFLTQREFGPWFLVGVSALGVATGAVTGWLTLYLPELFPTQVRASGAGTCYNAGRVLAAVGVLLTAGPLDMRGNYPKACAIVSLVYVLGIVLVPFLSEPSSAD